MRYLVWMPRVAYREAAARGESVPFPVAYDFVGVVEGADLEAGFRAGQNTQDPWNRERPTRSVRVGDVLTTGASAWRVADAGFVRVPASALAFV
jgi:hypothetical protein